MVTSPILKKISTAAGNRVAGLLIRLRLYRLLAAWLSSGVQEWLPDGSIVRFRRDRRPGLPLVLVLQTDRSPTDFHILAQSPDLRVLSLNEPWLSWIAYRFLPPGLGFSYYVVRDPIDSVRIGRAQLRVFLREFLPHFYQRVPASVVVRTDVKLQSDLDWCGVTVELGIPYVVLQRENIVAPGRVLKFRDRDAATLFEGHHIITYGHPMREHYIDAGVARADQVSALGCMRMDALIERLRSVPQVPHRSRITLFAIEPEIFRNRGPELETMYRDLHAELFSFARDHADVELVVKLKKQRAKGRYVDNILERILAAATAEGIDTSSLRNLLFTTEGDAQDYILNSSLVIGMNSTTVLEAAVAGRPVIMPVFESMRTPDYLAEIDYAEDLEAFDTPRDRRDLRMMLERRLADAYIAPETMERRWQLFDRYFHSREGSARQRIAAKIIEVARTKPNPAHMESQRENTPRADAPASVK